MKQTLFNQVEDIVKKYTNDYVTKYKTYTIKFFGLQTMYHHIIRVFDETVLIKVLTETADIIENAHYSISTNEEGINCYYGKLNAKYNRIISIQYVHPKSFGARELFFKP